MTSTGFRPLHDRVAIRPDAQDDAMRNGLYIPEHSRETPTQGTVVAVGATHTESRIGDRIIYGKYSGTTLVVRGEEYVLVDGPDILAVLDAPEGD